jgi:thioesterase domain-containing protein
MTVADRIERLTPAQRALFTARSQARRGNPATPDLPSTVLVKIKSTGPGTPFFCVHPGSGSVLCYSDLAARLGPAEPFHGIQPPPGAAHGYVMDELVATYAEAVTRERPHGAIRLGGWSTGGMIALAVAARLTAAGRTVDRLVLIDSAPPVPQAPAEPRAATLARLGEDLARRSGRRIDGLPATLAGLPGGPDVDRLVAVLTTGGCLPAARGEQYIRDRAEIAISLSRAVAGWTPPRHDGTVHVLRASGAGTSSVGWRRYAGRVIEIPVAGEHETMLSPPFVDGTAAALRAVLDGDH